MGSSMRLAVAVSVAMLLSGCASTGEAPKAGDPQGPVPDLRGSRVMVLPVQLLAGVPSGVTIDEEIAYALPTRGPRVSWVLPDEIDGILRRSPGINATTRNLPVGVFLQAEVNRIGDPLYGELRRMATLVGADFAFIPVQLSFTEEGLYTLAAVILDPGSGRVSWFGIIQGEAGAADAPGTVASVVDALARAILPFG